MSKSTIDVSKHATFKQLQALYANRQGNSIVGSKAIVSLAARQNITPSQFMIE